MRELNDTRKIKIVGIGGRKKIEVAKSVQLKQNKNE